MDILVRSGLISPVQTTPCGSLTDRAMRFIPLAGLVFGLAGCATLPETIGLGTPKVASLKVQQPSSEPSPENKEIVCQIQMIDGVVVSKSNGLKPGHHRLIVSLGAQEGEFSGDVDLVVPAAKEYRLKAEREDDTFTLSLVEVKTGNIVATSSAEASQVMTFQVFVMQK
jgi:hypothetical protein